MKEQKRSILVLAGMVVFVATGLFLPGVISAGDLEPGAAPGSTMHTLDEIYNKLGQLGGGGVAKTGQTICYDASGGIIDCLNTGQDGDIQAGVESPGPRFTDNADGTVTDNLTGLVWLKYANCDGTKIWADALTYCNGLANGSCGLTDGSSAGDWRLPNVKELQSLIDFGEYNPSLPSSHLFTSVQSYYYWSSTTYESDSTNAWTVFMSSGYVYDLNKTFTYYVWPVRGGN